MDQKSNNNSSSVAPSYFQVPDVATVTTQMIFQSGLSKDKLTDLGKKVILAFVAKLAYDNINKVSSVITSSNLRLSIMLFILKLTRSSKLKLKKDNDIIEVTTNVKIDQTKLQILFDIHDIKKDVSHFFHKICGHWVFVNNTETCINMFSLSSQFHDKFVSEYKLPTLCHNTITTQYKVLTITVSTSTITNNEVKDINFSWTNPTRITKTINNSNDGFFDMVSTFTVKSLKLEDTASQAYIINGPPGFVTTGYKQ